VGSTAPVIGNSSIDGPHSNPAKRCVYPAVLSSDPEVPDFAAVASPIQTVAHFGKPTQNDYTPWTAISIEGLTVGASGISKRDQTTTLSL
jgi:hypothetical protein